MLSNEGGNRAETEPDRSGDRPAEPMTALASAPGIRLADMMADALARLVEQGEIVHGERLPTERELMQRFGVSRAAVREAIATLASRGILHTRPGHRPIVQKPDFSIAMGTLGGLVRHLVADEAGVWNLFETRILLESALVRHAASHARPSDIEPLEAALRENQRAIGQSPRFYATDVAFHGMLYRIPGNPIYPAVHRAFVDWLSVHWTRMPRSVDIDRMNYKAHEAIFVAIVRRDPDSAERMLRAHLTAAWEFVRTTFEPERV